MENLVKQTCKEFNLTYKELGEKIGLSEASIKRLATSEINSQVEQSLKMLYRIAELEAELKDFFEKQQELSLTISTKVITIFSLLGKG